MKFHHVSIMLTAHVRLARRVTLHAARINASLTILWIMPRISTMVLSPIRSVKMSRLFSERSWQMAPLRVHSPYMRISFSTSLVSISMSMDVLWADMPYAYSAGASRTMWNIGWLEIRGIPTGEIMVSSAFCVAKITAASRTAFRRVCPDYKRSIPFFISTILILRYLCNSLKFTHFFHIYTSYQRHNQEETLYYLDTSVLYVCKQLVTI